MAKKAPQREIELEPPLGGVSENLAFEQQQPFTSPFMQNGRAYDPDEQKARVGQRPGTTKAYSTQVGGSHPIISMCSITTSYIKPE